MKQRLIVSLLFSLSFALLSTGCGESPQAKLIGKWEVDMAEVQAQMKASLEAELAKLPAGSPAARTIEQMGSAMMNMNIKSEMEFAKDGAFNTSTTMGEETMKEQATWKFVSAKGNEVLISTTAKDKTEQVTITVVNHDTLRLKTPTPEGRPDPMGMTPDTVTLKRKK